LYREKYFDFNVQHFHEKLEEEHGIRQSYTWVKTALQEAGLVERRKKRGSHRKRRPRRPLPGMMLHIDASEHKWFSDERKYELIVILDDASSEIYYAQLVEAESTRSMMRALREVIETHGVFCTLYSDRAGHFFITERAGGKVDKSRLTQVGRALQELGIKMIPAYSPQARGVRSETSGLGKADCRRNCACEELLPRSGRTNFYGTSMWPSSIVGSGWRQHRREPLCVVQTAGFPTERQSAKMAMWSSRSMGRSLTWNIGTSRTRSCLPSASHPPAGAS
jgi:hypothetical protein